MVEALREVDVVSSTWAMISEYGAVDARGGSGAAARDGAGAGDVVLRLGRGCFQACSIAHRLCTPDWVGSDGPFRPI